MWLLIFGIAGALIVTKMRSDDLARNAASKNPLGTGDPSTSVVAMNSVVLHDLGQQTRDLFTGAMYGTH